MIDNCYEFQYLKGVKTIGTIHNGEYQGSMDWKMSSFLPHFDGWRSGLLDWKGRINPMAAMIKIFECLQCGFWWLSSGIILQFFKA